jgi:AMP deaminase
MGQSRLREIFLKTDNEINGKYFGELIGETFRDFEESKYQLSEPRVSVYGRKRNEWSDLASWVHTNRLYSDNIRWLIQIPRLYDTHYKGKFIKSFQEMLDNIFLPLFEVTKDPSVNPNLHAFLQHVVGFDQVDDESLPEIQFTKTLKKPIDWSHDENPPYAYYAYYIYANLNVLNQFRAKQGLNTFAFRPHSGETGDIMHLGSAYLLTKGISHGIQLRKAPVLQYLYYLTQMGIAVSPLSNNFLFLNYDSNPFPQFFQRGLNVSLSTDDPLMFHFTREPLMEEYSVAAQVWQFSNSDLCEVARNSILQSGWEHLFKLHFLGEHYWLSGPAGNSIARSNVPNLRMSYRHETLIDEHVFIVKCLHLGNYKGKYPVPLGLVETKNKINRQKAFALKSAEHIDTIAKLSLKKKEVPVEKPPRLSVDEYIRKGTESRKEHKQAEHILLEPKKKKTVETHEKTSNFIYAIIFCILAILFNLLFRVERR